MDLAAWKTWLEELMCFCYCSFNAQKELALTSWSTELFPEPRAYLLLITSHSEFLLPCIVTPVLLFSPPVTAAVPHCFPVAGITPSTESTTTINVQQALPKGVGSQREVAAQNRNFHWKFYFTVLLHYPQHNLWWFVFFLPQIFSTISLRFSPFSRISSPHLSPSHFPPSLHHPHHVEEVRGSGSQD